MKKALMLEVEKRGVDKTLLVNAMNDYKEAANLARKRITTFDPVPLINALKMFLNEGKLASDPNDDLTQNHNECSEWDTEEQLSDKIDSLWKIIKCEKDKSKRNNLFFFFASSISRWSINLYLQEKYDKAILNSQTAIKLNKIGAEAFLLLKAKAYGYLQEWNKAIEDCNKAINLEPDYASAFYLKSVGHKNLDNLKEADKAFTNYKRLRNSLQNNRI